MTPDLPVIKGGGCVDVTAGVVVVIVSHPANCGSSQSLVSALKCRGVGHFCNQFKRIEFFLQFLLSG